MGRDQLRGGESTEGWRLTNFSDMNIDVFKMFQHAHDHEVPH